MADTLLFRGGSSADIAASTVQSREIVIDTDTDQIVSGASKKKTVMEDSNGNLSITGSASFKSGKVNIDSSGRLLVGTSSWAGGYSSQIIAGNTASTTGPGVLYLSRASANPAGGLNLGELKFSDANGSVAGSIVAFSDGAWATNDYPSRLVFSTTANGASSPAQRMLISPSGNISIGGTLPASPNITLKASGSIQAAGDVKIGGTSSVPNITLSANGSSTFVDSVQVLAPTGTGGRINLNKNGAIDVDNKTATLGAGLIIRKNGVRTIELKHEGDINIGGTLPASPNTTLKADGSGEFSGVVATKGLSSPGQPGNLDESKFGTRIGIDGGGNSITGYFITSRDIGGSGSVAAFFGNQGAAKIKGDGGAEFASDVKIGGTLPASPNTTLKADGRLLVGTSSDRLIACKQQILTETTETGTGDRGIAIVQGGTSPSGPILNFAKHRSNSIGGTALASNGDYTGSLVFNGSDGTNLIPSGFIASQVDGTPGADDMPGRLVFSTTANGASSPTERMRIDSSGDVKIGGTLPSSPTTTLKADGSITAAGGLIELKSSGQVYSNRTTGSGACFYGNLNGTNTSSILANGDVETAGDITCSNNSKGLILKSPNGTSFRLSVANDGTLSASSI